MNLKNKFCRLVDPATFKPPLIKIPGSAPGMQHAGGILMIFAFGAYRNIQSNLTGPKTNKMCLR